MLLHFQLFGECARVTHADPGECIIIPEEHAKVEKISDTQCGAVPVEKQELGQ